MQQCRSGDSYSAVGYDSSSPHPDRQQPLGVPKFGYTYTEDDDNDEGTPNWVGWLVTDFAREQNILVYDYAVGGVGVDDIPQQLHRHFLPTVGQRPEWAPWTADNSLFGRVPDSPLWALSDIPHSNLDWY